MIIDQAYIKNRIKLFLDDHTNLYTEQTQIQLPSYLNFKLLKDVFLHPANPICSIIAQYKIYKWRNHSTAPAPHSIYATNFIKYFFEENKDIAFDTATFFAPADEVLIAEFIDNRIRNTFAGFEGLPFTDAQKIEHDKIKKFAKKIHWSPSGFFYLTINQQKYYLKLKAFTKYVYEDHYGLKLLPPKVKEYISGKDFVDIGAFVGDVSLTFTQYNPSHIFAYEPVEESYTALQKTIVKNKKKDKITAIKKALGDECGFVSMNIKGDASTINPDLFDTENTTTVEISTLDLECKDRKIGLIKMDVEGFEYNVVTGGLNTIAQNKPIMLISVYHSPKDFFEIPPLLKTTCPDYTFKFVDLAPLNSLIEKIIIAYPTHLEEI